MLESIFIDQLETSRRQLLTSNLTFKKFNVMHDVKCKVYASGRLVFTDTKFSGKVYTMNIHHTINMNINVNKQANPSYDLYDCLSNLKSRSLIKAVA